jgi:hypothetical protein
VCKSGNHSVFHTTCISQASRELIPVRITAGFCAILNNTDEIAVIRFFSTCF